MKEAIIEAVKEGLRTVVLSVIPILLAGLNTQTGAITINWRVVLVVAVVSILKFIDQFLHEIAKRYENTDSSKYKALITGLTRF
jgi:type IV secretory pathway VirB2 component (pilin)